MDKMLHLPLPYEKRLGNYKELQRINIYCDSLSFSTSQLYQNMGCPRGVMVKAMDFGLVVSEFVLQSRYYVQFRVNTLGKSMNPLILPIARLLFF